MEFLRRTIALLLIVVCSIHAKYSEYGSVYYDASVGLFFVPNIIDKDFSIAYGIYNDTVEINGWGILSISAGYGSMEKLKLSKAQRNNLLMQAAGFIEGYLTAYRIQQHASNMYDFYFVHGITNNQTKAKIVDFLNEQNIWMRSQIKKQQTNPLWRHAGYVVSQYDGVVEGYRQAALDLELRNLTQLEFDILNDSGDLLDLQSAVNPSARPDIKQMSKNDIDQHLLKTTHCSALVKLLPGYENVFMSHSSWFTYQAMLRIFKHYDFNLDDPYTSAKGVSFSSYPGQINSLDDFYVMSNNLVMLQTTNGILNGSIYEAVTSEALLAWHRVRIANMLAANGEEWGNVLSLYNSGTYNNQYMVIDLNKIKLNNSIDDGALWVTEQIPGLVVYEDQTDILRAGYWPSYNVPFYEKIYNLSGYPEAVEKFGPEYSYQLAPRAKIFRRDQGIVHNLDTMKEIMRYNNYKNEEYSDGDSCKTICCRGDLESGGWFGGCYDTKVTDFFMAQSRTSHILNGPSVDGDLPPFSWSKFESVVHQGMPEVFNFSFVITKPFY